MPDTVETLVLGGLHDSIEQLATWPPAPGESPDERADGALSFYEATPFGPGAQTPDLDSGNFLGERRPIGQWAAFLRETFATSATYRGRTIVGVRAGGFIDQPRITLLAARNLEDHVTRPVL